MMLSFSIKIQSYSTRKMKKMYILSTAFSEITYAGSPDSPSAAIGVNLATM